MPPAKVFFRHRRRTSGFRRRPRFLLIDSNRTAIIRKDDIGNAALNFSLSPRLKAD
jgi:hypothetical protein